MGCLLLFSHCMEFYSVNISFTIECITYLVPISGHLGVKRNLFSISGATVNIFVIFFKWAFKSNIQEDGRRCFSYLPDSSCVGEIYATWRTIFG